MLLTKTIKSLIIGISISISTTTLAQETASLELDYAAKGFTLAEINLSNGNTVKFIDVPEMETIHMGEIAQAGNNEIFIMEMLDGDFLQKFLQLTNEDVPVPQSLIDLSLKEFQQDSDYFGPVSSDQLKNLPLNYETILGQETAEMLKDRQVTFNVIKPVYTDLEELGFKVPFNEKAAGSGSCNNSTGYQYFKDHHCGTIGNWGYGKSEGYCYNGMSQHIQKTSKIAMRNTYTRHATCGVGNGRVRHSRNQIGGFHTFFDAVSSPNSVETWQSRRSGAAWKRRAHFDKLNGNGYVRGWVKYFKQLTQ